MDNDAERQAEMRRERARALVARLRRGDERALADIFRAYYTPLGYHAHRIVHSWDIALDIVSDVFVSVWDKRQQIDPADLWAYLLTATRRRAFDVEEHRRVEDAAAARFTAAGSAPGMGSDALQRPDDALAAHEDALETAEQVDRAYAQLSPRTRAVVGLWANGLSYAEIARHLDIAEAALSAARNVWVGLCRMMARRTKRDGSVQHAHAPNGTACRSANLDAVLVGKQSSDQTAEYSADNRSLVAPALFPGG